MRTLRSILFAILLALPVLALFVIADRFDARRDLTLGSRSELSSQSRAAIAALPEGAEVIVHLPEGSPLREPVSKFVGRYRQLRPSLGLRFDGVDTSGDIEIRIGQRSRRLTQVDERTFTAALIQLARSDTHLVGFATGHAERRFDGEANHDLGRFGAALTERGERLIAVPLLQPVPQGLSLLVLASPSTPWLPAEFAHLTDFVEGGGALLWLTDPGPDGLDALLDRLGLLRLPGTVADAAGRALKFPDLRFLPVDVYPEHALTRDFSAVTLLPRASALAARPGGAFIAHPLLRSGAESWTETGADPDPAFDSMAGELPGPLDLAFALSRLSPSPDHQEQRVVVMGDGDFLSNQFLGNGGNRELGLRITDWLLDDDSTLGLDLPRAPDATLELSPRAAAWISIGWLIALPLLLLLGGAITVARRRRR